MNDIQNISNTWKVWWDSENKVVRHWSRGKNDEKLAGDSTEEMKKQLLAHQDAIGVMVDISKTTTVSGKAREIYKNFVNNLNKKAVFFGANRIMQVIVKFVFGSTNKTQNMKIVGSEQEALEWLKNTE